ncbi:hypothetical protein FNF28_00025 [Cafeteria roenbergensis]|uniref:Uncharacterized protein n=1 Tax=Cafeteria roenbergensis TaxID=33653 RepID=A0A5A8E8M9_CAFRO|nr:hypothetical protein FNF28_00025 [Cafeteria roenbergensis]
MSDFDLASFQPGALAELDDYLDGEWALGASVPGDDGPEAAPLYRTGDPDVDDLAVQRASHAASGTEGGTGTGAGSGAGTGEGSEEAGSLRVGAAARLRWRGDAAVEGERLAALASRMGGRATRGPSMPSRHPR